MEEREIQEVADIPVINQTKPSVSPWLLGNDFWVFWRTAVFKSLVTFHRPWRRHKSSGTSSATAYSSQLKMQGNTSGVF
jgi:hypothetical protein